MSQGRSKLAFLVISSQGYMFREIHPKLGLYSITAPLWPGDVGERAHGLETNSHGVGWILTDLVTSEPRIVMGNCTTQCWELGKFASGMSKLTCCPMNLDCSLLQYLGYYGEMYPTSALFSEGSGQRALCAVPALHPACDYRLTSPPALHTVAEKVTIFRLGTGQ